jgi:hypothetical protein
MRPWAEWTAKTALVAAGFAAAGGSLSGVALAGGVVPLAPLGAIGGSGSSSVLIGNQVIAPVRVPGNVCGNAAALLGIARAGCRGDVAVAAGVPWASALGAVKALAGLRPVSGLTSLAGVISRGRGRARGLGDGSADGTSGLGSSQIFGTAGSGTGNPGHPTSAHVVGLGTLPGLADLPSLTGLANLPVVHGVTGGGVRLPDTALTAANAAGMTSNSLAALVIGALLAGVSALKIASRRVRDRKTGSGVTI